MIELVKTTNTKFKYMQGRKVKANDFKIGLVIWFGDFHTSSLVSTDYIYEDDYTDLHIETQNSKYLFRIWRSNT